MKESYHGCKFFTAFQFINAKKYDAIYLLISNGSMRIQLSNSHSTASLFFSGRDTSRVCLLKKKKKKPRRKQLYCLNNLSRSEILSARQLHQKNGMERGILLDFRCEFIGLTRRCVMFARCGIRSDVRNSGKNRFRGSCRRYGRRDELDNRRELSVDNDEREEERARGGGRKREREIETGPRKR